MQLYKNIVDQWKTNAADVATILGISLAVLLMVVLAHTLGGVPYAHMTRDVASVAKVPFYAGFMSHLGLFCWSAATTICIFGFMVTLRHPRFQFLGRFLLTSALLTLMLGLDDAFLLHERVYPDYLGIHEKIVFLCYFVIILYYLIRFSKIILDSNWVFLLIAFIFFAISMGMDILHWEIIDPYLFEDSSKLTGIISWMVYFSSIVKSIVFSSWKDNHIQ